jgi:hypothetical protein
VQDEGLGGAIPGTFGATSPASVTLGLRFVTAHLAFPTLKAPRRTLGHVCAASGGMAGG